MLSSFLITYPPANIRTNVQNFFLCSVYIKAGEYGEGDVVCTTLPVVVATGAAVVFLQLCILVTCILCVYTARRGGKVGHRTFNCNRSMKFHKTIRDKLDVFFFFFFFFDKTKII